MNEENALKNTDETMDATENVAKASKQQNNFALNVGPELRERLKSLTDGLSNKEVGELMVKLLELHNTVNFEPSIESDIEALQINITRVVELFIGMVNKSKTKLDNSEMKLTQLEEDKDKAATELREQTKRFKEELEQKGTTNVELMLQKRNLEVEKEKADKQIQSSQAFISELQEKNTRLQEELKKYEKTDEQIAELIQQVNSKTVDLNRTTNELEQKKFELINKEAEKQLEIKKMTDLTASLEDFKQTLADERAAGEKLRSSQEALMANYQNQTMLLSDSMNEVGKLKTEKFELSTQNRDLETEKNRLNNQVSELQKQSKS